MRAAVLIVSLALLMLQPAQADELKMIISGKAVHIGANDLNENNYGLGLQYEIEAYKRWIPVITLASFKDSNDNTSSYIGAGVKHRFPRSRWADSLNVDVGAIALAMKRPDYNDDAPFLGALPFVSFSNDWAGVNITYVPQMEETAYPFWYFQFSFKLAEF